MMSGHTICQIVTISVLSQTPFPTSHAGKICLVEIEVDDGNSAAVIVVHLNDLSSFRGWLTDPPLCTVELLL
jgi:hypothetical protein